jgi:mandelamide amidase
MSSTGLDPYNAFVFLPPAPPLPADPGAGVPLRLAVKDSIDVAAMPTRAASPALPDRPAETDAPVVASLRAAGGLIVGKANMHELAFGITSENPWSGDVRNPVLPGCIAGGSSGGTAAAIAAGLADAGLATDTGGSARIPAAMCGLVGFRPSTGRYSGQGMLRLSETFDTVGPMGRTAAEVELLDAALVGRERLDPGPLAGARLALPRAYTCDDLSPAVAAAFERALDHLREAGCILVERDVPGLSARVRDWHLAIVLHEAERIWRALAEANGHSLAELAQGVVTPQVREIFGALAAGEGPSEAAYRTAVERERPALRQSLADYLADTDTVAIVAPAAPVTPPPFGPRPAAEDEALFHLLTRNMLPATIAEQPSICLATGGTPPVGVLLDGRPGEDEELLKLALAVESALVID